MKEAQGTAVEPSPKPKSSFPDCNSGGEGLTFPVEQSLLGVIVVHECQIAYANSALVKMLGYSTEVLLSLPFEKLVALVHPEDREAVLRRYRQRLAGQAVSSRNEYRIFHRTGEIRWLEVAAHGSTYRQRPAIQAFCVDITERKRAEEALRASEARFRSIFEHATIGLYRTTPDGRILMGNPALLNMLGYSSLDELAERNLEAEGYEPEYPRSEFMERIEANGRVIGFESAWVRRDGKTLYVRESATAIRDDEGRVLYYEGTVEDITERKRAEDERERLIARLQKALAEVRTLSGLLPICSNCKKIRDDAGYWTEVEVYLLEHSDADFTHGLCPDCAETLYPGYFGRSE